MRRTGFVVLLVVSTVVAAVATAGASSLSAAVRAPTRFFAAASGVQRISQDPLVGPPASQDHTQAEPDIAMDPNDANVVVATFQQGRFNTGGSVDPGFATSHDGGKTWLTGNLPHLTVAVGGQFRRASDPAVAFGSDGTVYITTLAFDRTRSAVVVQRSGDGGLHWSDPLIVQSDGPQFGNDKNWIAVDDHPRSPHYGRIYVTWDRETSSGTAPIMLRHSDDHGRHWSALVNVSGDASSGIGVQPLVQPDGALTEQYLDQFSGALVSQTSHDGGNTFDPVVTVDPAPRFVPPSFRCCLPSATVDPVTATMYVVWMDGRFRSDGLSDIVIWQSTNGGASWTGPRRVNHDAPDSEIDHFACDVAAHGRFVHVSFMTEHYTKGSPGRYLEERYIHSEDAGATFGAELTLGPRIDLQHAARASGTKFLGDYMGIAASAVAVHAVWARANAFPPSNPRPHNQNTWSATITK